MSADALGVNVKAISPWVGDPVTVNLTPASLPWGQIVNNGYVDDPTLPLTPEGYPLKDAATVVVPKGYPSGQYAVSYTGQATVSFGRIGTLTTPFTLGADGRYHGVLTIDQSLVPQGGSLYIYAKNLNPANPFGDLRIITPGYAEDTEQVFTNQFLAAMEPFSTLRFMEWNITNNSVQTSWDARATMDDFTWSRGAGMPYETIVDLANDLQKDVWINVPALATTDYIENLAEFFHENLDPNLKLYVEYSNETWNGIFKANSQIYAAAQQNPLVTYKTDKTRAVAQQTAYMIKEIGDIFKDVYGADADNVYPVLAGWATSDAYNRVALDFLKTNYGAVSNSIAAFATAPYFVMYPGTNVTGLTADALIASLKKDIETNFTTAVTQNAALSKLYNIPLVAYEGGMGISVSTTKNKALIDQVTGSDPRMYDLYQEMYGIWNNKVGGLFNFYASHDPYWGLLKSVNDPGGPKFDAIISEIYQPGDANLDGKVTNADLATVLENMGKSGKWWREGDFNHDGVVDATDLAIVRSAISGKAEGQLAGSDTLTRGSWIDKYGQDGQGIVGGATSYPSYATVSISNGQTKVWSTGTSDTRALETSDGRRLIGAWYRSGSSFTINVNLNDEQWHEVSIYAVDWDKKNRSQKIELVDAVTGNVLDSRSISSFEDGIYLTWKVAGRVAIRVTSLTSADAVVSGLFFNNTPTVSYVGSDVVTQGNWKGVYGADGYNIIGKSTSYPSYASVTPVNGSLKTWASSTSDVRALQLPGTASGRIASAWELKSQGMTVDVDLKDEQTHRVTIYAVDWEKSGRTMQIQLLDPETNKILDTRLVSSFSNGIYLTWEVSGNVRFIFSNFSDKGYSAVVSGFFFSTPNSSAAASAPDPYTSGSWTKGYGADGYSIAGDTSKTPSYATVSMSGTSNYTWTSNTSDARALQRASDTTKRVAAAWTNDTSFTVNINLTDGKYHRISAYFLDWSNYGKQVKVELIDASSGQVLDLQKVTSFKNGTYLSWVVKGNVKLRVTGISGSNALMSGLFFGSATQAPPDQDPPDQDPPGSSPTKIDKTTQGTWKGTYGDGGYSVANDQTSVPSYATMSLSGQSNTTWTAATQDKRALQKVTDTANRIASAWYSTTSMTVNLSFNDGKEHEVSVYMMDWTNYGRSQRIDVIDTATGKVLDSQTLSAFKDGTYMTWTLKGNVQIKLTCLAGPNALLNGIFFNDAASGEDSGSGSVEVPTTALIDQTTQGNWKNSYGSAGYSIASDKTSLPSYATVSMAGQTSHFWTSSTSEARALQQASSTTGRVAAAWFSTTSFTVNVSLNDGKAHKLTAYMMDWTNYGRSQKIELIDADTGAVLDTQNLSKFKDGTYMSWMVSGNVQLRITCTGGTNALLNGLFFD